MNIMIVGCGKVGQNLALELSEQGHDVSVVDRSQEDLDELPADFRGYITAGVPIDQDVLRHAGIENCDAFAAVTHDDNVNIMAAQLARDIFKVPKVVARVYDPHREHVFSKWGLDTICPTNLTVSAVLSTLTNSSAPQALHIGPRTVSFSEIPVPVVFSGHGTDELPTAAGEILFAVRHEDGTLTLIGQQRVILKEKDRLVFSSVVD